MTEGGVRIDASQKKTFPYAKKGKKHPSMLTIYHSKNTKYPSRFTRSRVV